MTPRITVMPQSVFDTRMRDLGINDSNVSTEHSNDAFISIIGTPECLNYYLDEGDTEHYFKESHDNVLNLEFDDIPCDEYDYHGHTFKGLSMEQAKQIYDFVEANKGKNFWIHCRAGRSRSMAVGQYIKYFYPDIYTNNYDTLMEGCNKDVYRKISRIFYKEQNIYQDE